MSQEAYKKWLPGGWKRFIVPIDEFISSYYNMSEKDKKKKYRQLVKDLSVDVKVIGDSSPNPLEGYKGLAKKLDKSEFDEQTAIEDLGMALLFVGYQIVDKSEINPLYFDAKREGNIEGLRTIIDYVQKSLDTKETS